MTAVLPSNATVPIAFKYTDQRSDIDGAVWFAAFCLALRMAKGLGTTQCALLIAAARVTIAEVDRQAGRRELRITPPILSMKLMLQDACEHGLLNTPCEPRRVDRRRLKTNETSRKMP